MTKYIYSVRIAGFLEPIKTCATCHRLEHTLVLIDGDHEVAAYPDYICFTREEIAPTLAELQAEIESLKAEVQNLRSNIHDKDTALCEIKNRAGCMWFGKGIFKIAETAYRL